MFSDLTLIPPPKTPDDETLIDFTSLSMSVPPPGFDDSNSPPRNGHNGHTVPPDLLPSNVTEMPPDLVDLPPDLADLPTPIRERIDALVHSNQDLNAGLEAMDAILLGECENYCGLVLLLVLFMVPWRYGIKVRNHFQM